MSRTTRFLSLLLLSLLGSTASADPAPFFVRGELRLLPAEVQLTLWLHMDLVDRIAELPREDMTFLHSTETDALGARLAERLHGKISLNEGRTAWTGHRFVVQRIDDLGDPDLLMAAGALTELTLLAPRPAEDEGFRLTWDLLSGPYLRPGEILPRPREGREAVCTVILPEQGKRTLVFDAERRQWDLSEFDLPPAKAEGHGRIVLALLWACLTLGALGAGLAAAARKPRWVVRSLLSGLALGLTLALGLYFSPPRVSQTRAGALLLTLLQGVYHSFDAPDEAALYDSLAQRVHPDLREAVYLEIRQGLSLRSFGDRQINVQNVELLSLSPLGTNRWEVHWRITGYLGHWGHLHRKIVTCSARIQVTPQDGLWLISAFDMLQQSEEIPGDT